MSRRDKSKFDTNPLDRRQMLIMQKFETITRKNPSKGLLFAMQLADLNPDEQIAALDKLQNYDV